MKSEEILQILFILVLLFIGKQLFDGYKNRKRLEDPISLFNQRTRLLMAVSSGMLVALGVFYMIMQPGIMAAVYILLGIAFIYLTFEKIQIAGNGIYYNGKLTRWTSIKQWGFTSDGKFLNLEVHENNRKIGRMIPTKPEDRETINNLIRQAKSKKANRLK